MLVAVTLVDRATIFAPTSSSDNSDNNHFFAVLALVIVSIVVKVFEAIKINVDAGFKSVKVS